MAAGTAAALVPIRSITRAMDPASPQSLAATVKQHARLSVKGNEETVTYIPDSDEEPGALCVKLVTQLQGIQLGKLNDEFGWCFKVSEEDGKAVVGRKAENGTNGGQTVDQLD